MIQPVDTLAQRRPGERGLTLLEVIVATAVLTVGLCGAAAAQLGALSLSREARDLATAAGDLTSAVELVTSVPVEDDLLDAFPPGTEIAAFNDCGLPPADCPEGRDHLDGERIVVDYPTPGSDPIEVRLTITWNDSFGEQRRAIIAALARAR